MTDAAELDIEQEQAVLQYLRQREEIGRFEKPNIHVLTGGVSSRVVLVRRQNGVAMVLKQALSKLRVGVDWFSSPNRVHQEATAMRWLTALGLPVPALKFEDSDRHILAMDAVPEPHENWKAMLLGGRVEDDHIDSFSQILADLHMRSAAKHDEIQAALGDWTYFESLRVEPYYTYTAEQVPPARKFIRSVIDSTRANRVCLVHGDFSPKNILVFDQHLVLLDHEVAHFGDPAFDVGFSTTHFLSKANHLPAYRNRFEAAATRYWTGYWRQISGEDWAPALEARAVPSTLACLLARVAGRSQLEYLSPLERTAQRQVVLQLMLDIPSDMPELISRFIGGL